MLADNRLFLLLGTLAAGWIVYLLTPILTPFVFSALLAYLADPLVDRLQKFKLSRSLAVLIVFVLMSLFVVGMVALVIPLVRVQIAVLLDQIPNYIAWVESHFLPYVKEQLGIEMDSVRIGLAQFLKENWGSAGQYAGNALKVFAAPGGWLIASVVNLLLVPVVTFYLLRDWDDLVAHIGSLIPEERREKIFRLARDSDEMLSAFLRGQVAVMFALSIIYTVGLALLGLDNAFAIGVIAGLVSFVPYLGFIVGILLAGLAAVVQFGPLHVAYVVGVFAVGQMIEGMFLTPKFVGDRIGLHPVLVIFAVMAGGQLFGFFGVLLALPVASVVSVVVRFAYDHYRSQGDVIHKPHG